MNKVDELRMLINDKQPDVCCICESWITSDTATERYSIEGYNVFNYCRSNRKGGGILTYVKDNIAAEIFSDIVVPDELEAQWLVLKHPRLPRVAPYIVLGSVYLPSRTEAENGNVMLTHLHTCVDLTRVKKPQAGIFICGDLNRLNISSLCTDAQYSTSIMQDHDHHQKSSSPVMIQMGNNWLTWGHGLHYITKKTNQMKLIHTLCWKQCLQGHPQSSKSVTESSKAAGKGHLTIDIQPQNEVERMDVWDRSVKHN
ncbi:uncharacterized protein LOC117117864 [Anneissia japonica]|uniref:uncharacterized protein LOC117117864 n=1 Tax=Anneissia japonica TaxID=1529436 RepID=UPI0014258F81|nr:uncharacterized protein LOC117117864 [Anneissia japonica]